MLPSIPASDYFYINSENGEIRVRNSVGIKTDTDFQYKAS